MVRVRKEEFQDAQILLLMRVEKNVKVEQEMKTVIKSKLKLRVVLEQMKMESQRCAQVSLHRRIVYGTQNKFLQIYDY